MAEDNFFLLGGETQTSNTTIFDVPVPLSKSVGASFARAYEDNPFYKIIEKSLEPETGKTLSRDKALKIAQDLNIPITIDEDTISSDALQFRLSRQARTQQYERTQARQKDGFVATALGIGAGFAAGVTDPINFGTAFVPFLGPARYSAILAKAATPIQRLAIRAGVGAVEGGAITAAIEPANYAVSRSLGDDYTGYDSFMNIAFGTGLSAGFAGGGGLIADGLQKSFGGAINNIPPKARAEIQQAAAHVLLRDGDVDIKPLLNAELKARLLYDLNEIPKVKGIQNETPISLARKKALAQLMKDSPELKNRIDELELKVGKNPYERALNDYNEAQNFQAKTPEDEVVKSDNLQRLEETYGKGFKDEADAYDVYAKKQDSINNITDRKRIKTLTRESADLDKKFGGRLSSAYEVKRNRELGLDDEYNAARDELKRINDSSALPIEMQRLKMQDMAQRQVTVARENFARTSMGTAQKIIDRDSTAADKIVQDLKNEPDIDDELVAMESVVQEFEQRTGIKLDVDGEDFNPKTVVDSMRKYINCIRS